MFSIKPKTLHYWYKENLSSYTQAVAEGKWGEKKYLLQIKIQEKLLKKSLYLLPNLKILAPI